MLYFNNFRLGGLLFQLNGISFDLNYLGFGVCRGGWDDIESYNGVFLASYKLNDFIETPANHINHLAFLSLTNRHYFVVWKDLLRFVCRTHGNQADYLGVFIFALQNSTNSLQREAHVYVEVLRGPWGEVLRVRVVGTRKSIHV